MTTELYRDGDYHVSINGRKITVGRGVRTTTETFTGQEELCPVPEMIASGLRRQGANPTNFVWPKGHSIVVRKDAAPALQTQIDRIKEERFGEQARERQRLSAAIPGLEELQTAYDEQERYASNFQKMMEDENNDGTNLPSIPADTSKIEAVYHVAAAYLECKRLTESSSWTSGRGNVYREAMEKIEAGENHDDVLEWANETWIQIAIGFVERS